MASAHLKGSARFEYDPGTTVAHLLAVPLLDIVPITVRTRHEWWSVDRSAREVVTIGDEVRDIVATIRFENEPDALTALLRAGLEDALTLTYFKEESAEGIPCKLVAIAGAREGEIPLEPDPDRHGFGEYATRVHLRAVGSADWSALL